MHTRRRPPSGGRLRRERFSVPLRGGSGRRRRWSIQNTTRFVVVVPGYRVQRALVGYGLVDDACGGLRRLFLRSGGYDQHARSGFFLEPPRPSADSPGSKAPPLRGVRDTVSRPRPHSNPASLLHVHRCGVEGYSDTRMRTVARAAARCVEEQNARGRRPFPGVEHGARHHRGNERAPRPREGVSVTDSRRRHHRFQQTRQVVDRRQCGRAATRHSCVDESGYSPGRMGQMEDLGVRGRPLRRPASWAYAWVRVGHPMGGLTGLRNRRSAPVVLATMRNPR